MGDLNSEWDSAKPMKQTEWEMATPIVGITQTEQWPTMPDTKDIAGGKRSPMYQDASTGATGERQLGQFIPSSSHVPLSQAPNIKGGKSSDYPGYNETAAKFVMNTGGLQGQSKALGELGVNKYNPVRQGEQNLQNFGREAINFTVDAAKNIGAGYKGLYDLARGKSLEEAAKGITETQAARKPVFDVKTPSNIGEAIGSSDEYVNKNLDKLDEKLGLPVGTSLKIAKDTFFQAGAVTGLIKGSPKAISAAREAIKKAPEMYRSTKDAFTNPILTGIVLFLRLA